MSYLNQLPDSAVQYAAGRSTNFAGSAAMDRDLVRRIAWALFRQFADQTIRVPFLFGMTWKVKLRDLHGLWVALFGAEDAVPPIEMPFPDAA